jgi:hypothetical protein
MSSNTTNALNAIKGINSTFTGKGLTNLTGKTIVTSTPKRNHRLTEEQKEGIQKMITLFGSMNYVDRELIFCIGTHSDGSPHLIVLKGLAINRHLKGVLDFEVYGDDGREILNGIRELYLTERSEGGLVKKW